MTHLDRSRAMTVRSLWVTLPTRHIMAVQMPWWTRKDMMMINHCWIYKLSISRILINSVPSPVNCRWRWTRIRVRGKLIISRNSKLNWIYLIEAYRNQTASSLKVPSRLRRHSSHRNSIGVNLKPFWEYWETQMVKLQQIEVAMVDHATGIVATLNKL